MSSRVPAIEKSKSRICFLDIPPEIRTVIYELAVVDDHCQVFRYGLTYTDFEQPALARTCRTVRLEILPIFYSKNKFAFKLYGINIPGPFDSDAVRATDIVERIVKKTKLFPWLRKIGVQNVASIKSLTIQLSDWHGRLRAERVELQNFLVQESKKMQASLPSRITLTQEEPMRKLLKVPQSTELMTLRFSPGYGVDEDISATRNAFEADAKTPRVERGKECC